MRRPASLVHPGEILAAMVMADHPLAAILLAADNVAALKYTFLSTVADIALGDAFHRSA